MYMYVYVYTESGGATTKHMVCRAVQFPQIITWLVKRELQKATERERDEDVIARVHDDFSKGSRAHYTSAQRYIYVYTYTIYIYTRNSSCTYLL